METPFDWITVMLFAGLVTHFLAHSVAPDGEDISLRHYLLLSVGCAAANWLGNKGWIVPALLVLLGGAAYAYHYLGPARPPRQH